MMSVVAKTKKYTMFPIEHADVWSLYKKAVAAFWTPEEVDLSKDRGDFENLSKNEQHFVKHVLAFFAGSDGIVLENLVSRFMNDIDHPEIRAFYGFQVAVESIHSETYSLLIEHLVDNAEEKHKLFNAITEFPSIKMKADWALKWVADEDSSFATRLVAFAAVEGIFFSGSFCSIYWLKKRGLMPGLALSNEFISRDEALHTDFAVLLYQKFAEKLDNNVIRDIICEAVEIEQQFITESLPVSLIGMNATHMKTYIEFVADRLLVQFGNPKYFESKNPFEFMEMLSIDGKTNFFEKRVSEYSKANINSSTSSLNTFSIDDDF